MRKLAIWPLILLLLLVGCDDQGDDKDAGGPGFTTPAVTFGNGLIELAFERATGRIVQITDWRKSPPLQLIDEDAPAQTISPFEIYEIYQAAGAVVFRIGQTTLPPQRPRFRQSGNRLQITWGAAGKLPTVKATWTLTPGQAEARVEATVGDLAGRRIYSLRYPVLPGLKPLAGDGTGDQYLLSLEGGMLLQKPLDRLTEELRDGTDDLRNQLYPLGHRSMAQMTGYLHPGVGGMLLYTADGAFGAKAFELDAERIEGESPTYVPVWRVQHFNSDVTDQAGRGVFEVGYPTVLRWLDYGSWFDAAETYRAWSDQQVWAGQPLAERDPAERAFFEQLGASVFGLSARVDQRPWIEAFHDQLVPSGSAADLLFVLGWDFHPLGDPEATQFNAMQQAGKSEPFWRPFVGSTYDNLAQVREQGDAASLFLYDLLIHSAVPGWNGFAAPPGGNPWSPEYYGNHVILGPDGQPGEYTAEDEGNGGGVYTLDPADPFVADYWLWRDRLLVNETDPPLDALYFDLGFSAANVGDYSALRGRNSGHPAGMGRWWPQGVRDALNVPRGTPNPRGFRYGAENAAEPYVDLVDFWHLGATGDGPLRNRVRGSNPPVFRGADRWVMDGTGVQVPLLAYLDHHNGALRTGGKLMASEELGDVFYWIVASEYVWGGVIELIYFNTPVDWLPGMAADKACVGDVDACAFQTDWTQGYEGSRRRWVVGDEVRRADPDKLAFLRDAIALRVDSPAQPYLTLGRMAPPPRLDPEPADEAFAYSFYSSILGPNYYHDGEWSTAPVVVTAWRHPTEGRVALIVANAADHQVSTRLAFDPLLYYGLAQPQVVELSLDGAGEGTKVAAEADEKGLWRIPADLAPRSFRVFELAAE